MLDVGEAFEIDPVMPPLIDRDTRRREIGISEGARRDGENPRDAAQFPIDGRAAWRAETEVDGAAAVALARERRALARDAGYILATCN